MFQIPLMSAECENEHLAIITYIRSMMRAAHTHTSCIYYEIAMENVASLELCDSFDTVFAWWKVAAILPLPLPQPLLLLVLFELN